MDYVSIEKLKWRSRRSMLELDLYFNRFIQSGNFARLNEEELIKYQYLLTFEDGDLLLLFQGKEQLIDSSVQAIIDKIVSANFS